jgi:ubiquitin-conjugating enzyme E2 Z
MDSLCIKRLAGERRKYDPNGDFFINWKDDNLRKFEAYIVAPKDSLYCYKLVKLRFNFPYNYPQVPPKVGFVQYNGERLHPNLYKEGKVCLSILGTWDGPGWAMGMNTQSILTSIWSLLDNEPYKHEPRQNNNPAFNAYVQYHSWRWMLLDYLDREQDPAAKTFLEQHFAKHGTEMVAELERQKAQWPRGGKLVSPYARQTQTCVDYDSLIRDMKKRLPEPAALEPQPVTRDNSLKRKRNLEAE